jgi:tRNA (guanosine-2'-O-)-methyltransferase
MIQMTPERFEKLKAVLNRRQPDLTVLADDVHKSHNIAAVLRTCDAVGIYRVHAVSPRGEMRRHHMVSGGSKRWVDMVIHAEVSQAVKALRKEGWQLIAAHPGEDSQDYRDVDYTNKLAVLLGAELGGLTPYLVEVADKTVAIPMEGMVASLNVSVAAALILYEAQRQRRAAGLYQSSRLEEDEYKTTLFEWAYPEIAERCRKRGISYPELKEDGSLVENPLQVK